MKSGAQDTCLHSKIPPSNHSHRWRSCHWPAYPWNYPIRRILEFFKGFLHNSSGLPCWICLVKGFFNYYILYIYFPFFFLSLFITAVKDYKGWNHCLQEALAKSQHFLNSLHECLLLITFFDGSHSSEHSAIMCLTKRMILTICIQWLMWDISQIFHFSADVADLKINVLILPPFHL